MTSLLRFRNLEVAPDDPVEVWPVEAMATALDRGQLPDWHRLAVAVEADPYGVVSRRLEEALDLVDSSGVGELMEQVLAEVRAELARDERRRVANEIRRLVGMSGLPVTEFAASIGTSASRLSTYMHGKVTPSAALMLRIRERAKAAAPGGAGSPGAMAPAPAPRASGVGKRYSPGVDFHLMRAVVLDLDERSIAERHRLGLDKRDEMWKGVLHVVPPASERHQSIEFRLAMALEPAARAGGLRIQVETGVFAASDDYRVPDVVAYSQEARSARGVDGAPALVIEVRSPGDETDEKVPWYLGRGAREVLVVDRDSLVVELFGPEGPVPAEPDGSVVLDVLGGARISRAGDTLVVDGEALEL